jgi:hypothetical protein
MSPSASARPRHRRALPAALLAVDPDTRKGTSRGPMRIYPALADSVGWHVVGGTNFTVKSLEVWNLDPDKLYGAFVRADDGEVVAKVSGNVNETSRAQYERRQIDTSAHVGEELHIEIVDRATGGFGHLSVDDIDVPVAADTTRTDGEPG